MDILMPQLGETVAEGKITTWFKAVGDAVKPGDNLFEIETDKVSMEVPATSTGVLSEIRVAAGAIAPVGAVVAVVAGAGGMVSATAPAATAPAPAAPPPIAPRTPVVAPPPASQASAAPAARPIVMDPFREVRTPAGSPARRKSISAALRLPVPMGGSSPAMWRPPSRPVPVGSRAGRQRRRRIASKPSTSPAATRKSPSTACGAPSRHG
jgi:pyruvate/2-oxoglutarate dehydrogenase complex dihydrolipoamide acyltransferase (E2) component